MVQELAGATASRTMTLSQWAELPEDEPGELVDGVLVEEETASFVHELIAGWLLEVLRGWARGRGALVAGSGVKLRVSANRGRMADVVVYARGAPRPQPRGLVDVPPTIAIEVVTGTPRDERRDRVEKLEEYARFGVRWYWIVEPELRIFEILERSDDGRYVHAVSATHGAVAIVPGCEGLRLDIAGLWAEVDAVIDGDPKG